ncbi:MAG: hypothetical protein ABI382_05695 [Nakamurella sp.]
MTDPSEAPINETTGMTAEPGAVPDSTPGFTAVTVAALQGAGRMVATDWESETFDVLPRGDNDAAVSGVILHSSKSVAFYAVWDEFVPSDKRTAVGEWSVRANTDLSTCTIEFSLDSGILAIRSVVTVGALSIGTPGEDIPVESLAISRAAFAVMLSAAVDDAVATFTRLQGPVAELIGAR